MELLKTSSELTVAAWPQGACWERAAMSSGGMSLGLLSLLWVGWGSEERKGVKSWPDFTAWVSSFLLEKGELVPC